MTTIEGNYFGGSYPIAVPASITFRDREVGLAAGSVAACYKADQLKVSPRVGSTCRFVTLPGGGQFECADHALLDSLPQESRSEGLVAWLEQRWAVALAGVALMFVILLVGYFFGLPAAAKHVAYRIPLETERSLGYKTLAYMDKRKWLRPTSLDFDIQEKIKAPFYRLCSDLPQGKYYHLEFRNGGILGSNAIALPGGFIIITDEMVETAEEMEELMAVLAHEIGHVELRHTMRSVLQSSAIGVIAAAVTSDAATISAAVTGLPVLLAQTKYSRDFETAADDYAFALLEQKGFPPRHSPQLWNGSRKSMIRICAPRPGFPPTR